MAGGVMSAADQAPVLIVGAGLAGASCARRLAGRGVPVRVIDRAGEPGGRIASPQLNGRRVDIGASYFTVSDPGFERVVSRWQSSGLARAWTDTFDVFGPQGFLDHSKGPMRWTAAHGLQSLVSAELGGIEVRVASEATALHDRDGLQVDAAPASAVVLAMPDPQAARLLPAVGPLGRLRGSLNVDFDPVIATVLGWPERNWPFTDGAFVNDDERISFVADDGARRGDRAPVLVVHSTASLARTHADDPEAALADVCSALREVFGIRQAASWRQSHRWETAKPAEAHAQLFGWHELGVGVAGDAWCPQGRPRMESAWLSGTALADHIADHIGY